MSKHTPKPWTVYHDQTRYGSYKIAEAAARERAAMIQSGNHARRSTRAKVDRSHGEMIEGEREANARLIAAAPELLEAANDLIADMQPIESDVCDHDGLGHCSRCCACGECTIIRIEASTDRLIHAIAKAEEG